MTPFPRFLRSHPRHYPNSVVFNDKQELRRTYNYNMVLYFDCKTQINIWISIKIIFFIFDLFIDSWTLMTENMFTGLLFIIYS